MASAASAMRNLCSFARSDQIVCGYAAADGLRRKFAGFRILQVDDAYLQVLHRQYGVERVVEYRIEIQRLADGGGDGVLRGEAGVAACDFDLGLLVLGDVLENDHGAGQLFVGAHGVGDVADGEAGAVSPPKDLVVSQALDAKPVGRVDGVLVLAIRSAVLTAVQPDVVAGLADQLVAGS